MGRKQARLHAGVAILFAFAAVFGVVWLVQHFKITGLVHQANNEAAVIEADIIALTNERRSAAQLQTLAPSSALSKAALRKAEDMARKGYFSHRGPDGKEPWGWIVEAGYRYTRAGENLAVRFTESGQVVEAWMASPSHRANILKPNYSEIGVGMAEGMFQGQPATYVVQYFGTPALNAAAVALTMPGSSTYMEAPVYIPGAGVVVGEGLQIE
jgi:hypothetical protein